MKKLITSVLLLLFPALALADGSLSFAPPASDYSVIFLGNLFGVVDGVLHGSGSQIMGNMFGVFNSAVLALGGIIIMYTLMVSTLNTAHEGQMLGQKWSSIWIPVRSTMGLALLIPKASGYCLMQIFVMWIVVQGIGAADKVWEAALSYLNRGGVIIQAQSNPATVLTQGASSGVSGGAMTILAGQVCMMGLQQQLETQRQNYINAKQNNSGPCAGTPDATMQTFCDTAVPEFVSTVNAVTTQNNVMTNNKAATSFSVTMPNFPTGSPYLFLNGICGTINWNSISELTGTPSTGTNNTLGDITNITASELQTAQMSRAIAIQQMYLDLSSIAQVMVNNNPAFANYSSSGNSDSNPPFSLVATQQFGVPYTANGTICSNYGQTCVIWGPLPTGNGTSSAVLFNGTEFQGAITDYNGIMMPTLNLISQMHAKTNDNKSRDFIANASTQGWMMAGAYFFDLVTLNGNAAPTNVLTETNTGLDNSTFLANSVMTPFGQDGSCVGQYAQLCTWFNQDSTMMTQVESLIDGTYLQTKSGAPVPSNPVPVPDLKPDPQRTYVEGLASSTVYGFINNSMMVQLPGQPGLKPLQFANLFHFSVDTTPYYMPEQKFACGPSFYFFHKICVGEIFGDVFYNGFFRWIYNFFLGIFTKVINQVAMAFLMIPLQGMSDIFKTGLQTLSMPGVNPIVALANMGSMYINFSGNLWMMLLSIAISSAIMPIFGVFIFALMTMAMPLLLAWIGIMVGVGFTTAYYIPILPYMIFTFGVIGWLITVIEAMVAAPIVALGVTHPEGHDAFGKGEAAIMILMNVFLRPAMMIIGYIAAIALSYVGIWILNAGFDHAIGFIQNGSTTNVASDTLDKLTQAIGSSSNGTSNGVQATTSGIVGSKSASGTGGYTEWSGIFAYFFSILIYTTMYLIIVQRAFTLISYLPDKVLRWIGGQPESIGQESSQWGEELKQSGKEAGGKTQDAQGQIDKQLGASGQKVVGAISNKVGKLTDGGSIGGKGAPEASPSKQD